MLTSTRSRVISVLMLAAPVALTVPPAACAADSLDLPGKYVIASMVLPGSGEFWRGSRAKGEAFLWTDAAIWLSYGGLTVVGNARNHDAKVYAGRYAGASPNVADPDYYVALERYPNSDIYNEDVRRDARDIYPDDPERQKTYYQTHGYFGDEAWNWGSDSLRFAYWERRKAARALTHAAAFFLGGALLNRLVSAVDVAFFTPARTAAAGHHPPSSPALGRLELRPELERPGLALHYRF